MANTYTFITADDHSVITKSISFILKDLYSKSTVLELNCINDLIKTLYIQTVDLLLLDITFPDGNTLNIIPTIRKIQPNIKILIFSGMEENIYALRYINAGANGYLSKLSSEEEIKEAIKKIMVSGKYLSEKIQDKITNNYIFKKVTNPLEALSNRELEITHLMIEGYGNTEICSVLDLQKSTVSTYKTRIFEKLGVDNLSDLIQLFNLYKEV